MNVAAQSVDSILDSLPTEIDLPVHLFGGAVFTADNRLVCYMALQHGDSFIYAAAERITLCLNSHDALLAALRGLMPEGDEWSDGTMDHMPGIKAARAILAKLQS